MLNPNASTSEGGMMTTAVWGVSLAFAVSLATFIGCILRGPLSAKYNLGTLSQHGKVTTTSISLTAVQMIVMKCAVRAYVDRTPAVSSESCVANPPHDLSRISHTYSTFLSRFRVRINWHPKSSGGNRPLTIIIEDSFMSSFLF